MAQRIEVIVVDDLDGTSAAETVHFGLDGVNYEIDLSPENAEKLRQTFAQYVEVARRVSGRRTRGTGAKTTKASQIRDWANENGYEVSPRGRVSAEIREAYEKAHR